MNGGRELSPHWANLVDILKHQRITLVLDVGANVGQYASYLRQSGYEGRIVSFEPLAEAWEDLRQAAVGDPAWEIPPRMAIGDVDGKVTLFRSAESDMSSILPLEAYFLATSPDSEIVGREVAPVARLDTIFGDHVHPADRVFVKIDTQGYERQVLVGCKDILDSIAGFQVEMSLIPLYAGEALFDELLSMLHELGFSLFQVIPGYYSRHLHRQLQVDGVFFRTPE
jgi:FkbM family methyltransferase